MPVMRPKRAIRIIVPDLQALRAAHFFDGRGGQLVRVGPAFSTSKMITRATIARVGLSVPTLSALHASSGTRTHVPGWAAEAHPAEKKKLTLSAGLGSLRNLSAPY